MLIRALRYWISAIIVAILSTFLVHLIIRYIKLSWCNAWIKIGPDKCVLITGATSGIGLLLTKHFHSLGFTILAAYYNDREPGYAELYKLESSKRMFLVKMDVRSQDSIQEARKQVDKILVEHGLELFCLINNAGLGKGTPFEWEDKSSIKDLMDTNLIGMIWVTREFLYRIIQCQGRVVNVSSGLGMLPLEAMCTYCSSKSAVISFSEALQLDLARYGVRSCCVMPGDLTDKSNIMFGLVRSLEEARKKLSAEEAARYKESIESRYKIVQDVIKRRMKAGEEQEWRRFLENHQLTSVFSLNDSGGFNESKNDKPNVKTGLVQRLLISFTKKTSGEVKEFNEILTGFEQVVCLQKPPSHAYPGNMIYTHLVGPGMELIPLFLRGYISRISSNLLWQKN